MRPGMVLTKDGSALDLVRGLGFPSVKVNTLAKVIVDVALNGSKDDSLENVLINQLGS